MRIRNGHPCTCEDVAISELVACCPDCGHPIAASSGSDSHGFCTFKYEGGRCFYDRNVMPPSDFTWTDRLTFNQSDLPEFNGWRAINNEAAEAWLKERAL